MYYHLFIYSETLVQLNKDGGSSKVSKDILTTIKFDFENNLKTLDNKVKDAVKDIKNNKMNCDKYETSLDQLKKQFDSEKEKSQSINKDFRDLKKSLGSVEDKLTSKLVADMALQSNHFQTFISSEVGNQDAKLSLAERKWTSKFESNMVGVAS